MIRRAVLQDIPALMDIYNEAILHTTATFDTELLYDVLDSVYDTELPDEMYDSMDAGEGTEAEVAE